MKRTEKRCCAPWRGAALVVALVLFAWPALAQIPDETPLTTPLPAGPFMLYPWFETNLGYTDNLFYSSDRPPDPETGDPGNPAVETGIVTLTPGILAELPLNQSRFRLGYALQYRDFTEIQEDWNRFSHFFLAQADLLFSSGLRLDISDNFQRGVLDTRTFDPGGEITFRGDEFTANVARVELSKLHSNRRLLALVGEYGVVRFDREVDPLDPEAPSSNFFDSDTVNLGLTGQHRRGRRTWFEWNAFGGRTDLDRPLTPTIDDRRRIEDLVATVGVRFDPNPVSSLIANVGWQHSDFDSLAPDVFSGPTGQLAYAHRAPGRFNLVARVIRDVYPSVYRNNNYYVSDQATLEAVSSGRSRLVLGVRASYFVNNYPEVDPTAQARRRDTILDGTAWIGYRFRPGLEWSFFARVGSRSSNVEGLEFDTNRVGFTFRVGA